MRLLFTLVVLCAIGYGVWWLNEKHPDLKHKALEIVNVNQFHALEPRFTSHQIMEKEFKENLGTLSSPHPESSLRFFPYLLLDVKFTDLSNQTAEGVMLWNLFDGEMVINTKDWEETHGFADCIRAEAGPGEYKVLQALSSHGGQATHKELLQSLNMGPAPLNAHIEHCLAKRLIVRHDHLYRIHLQTPNLHVQPITHLSVPFIPKQSKEGRERVPRRFSPFQIKKAAEAAFGSDFYIRNTQEIFVPVYLFSVQSEDGSMQTLYFNGLNGKKVEPPASM